MGNGKIKYGKQEKMYAKWENEIWEIGKIYEKWENELWETGKNIWEIGK